MRGFSLMRATHILESRTQLPTVGITVSGGGYRAAIFGAGVLNALDGRNSSSVKKGTGGLLQSATHLAGLSGGSWLVTSLAQANLPTIQHLVLGDGHHLGGWLPESNLWSPSADPAEQAVFAQEILQELAIKAEHFPLSVGDTWGRALARRFSNATTSDTFFSNTSHGSGILFPDLANPSQRITICAIMAEILAENTANFSVLINETYPQPALRHDTSNYPNPFHSVTPATFSDSQETVLALCDGGEDGQISPLQPMLVPDRNIDVILAIDGTNDADGFAAGASLIATQERMQIFVRGLAAFPPVPPTLAGFANLTAQPTFFGCLPASHNGYDETRPAGPMLVYLPNGAPSRDGSPPLTNTSTFQETYTADEMQGMLAQTFTIATQGAEVDGALEDGEWAACLACAVVDRARARQGVKRSGVCGTCFERYCWEG
ncbi:lysophospholipase [Mycena metata]|uniref:Lysophospholipase n=1 Tax=Mycena metata TaxID=1033252 RepID=A0AAD7N291_9AGAR|nr:lysophospholipase [Mycena metata]